MRFINVMRSFTNNITTPGNAGKENTMSKEIYIVTGRCGVELESPNIFLSMKAAEDFCKKEIYDVIYEDNSTEIEDEGIDTENIDDVLAWAFEQGIYDKDRYSAWQVPRHDHDYIYERGDDWIEYQIYTATVPEE